MRGRAPGHDQREQDGLAPQGVLHASAGQQIMKKRGEIDIFDAGKYFAGAQNQHLRTKDSPEMEDDQLDDEGKAVDADGNLPLSPLPDFYISGKTRHMPTKHNQQKSNDEARRVFAVPHGQGNTTVVAGRVSPASIDRKHPLQSPPPLAVSSHSTNPLPLNDSPSGKSQGKSGSSSKPQAFSPSMRLASFLARFKLSSESKTKPQSKAVLTTTSTPGQEATTPPKSSFFSHTSSLPSNSKPPSPRGRFLRALSSSSSQNSLLKPISHMHHHGAIAASTPVSPAGSDPYSPITHSATTTPTSRKNPRSRPRSHIPTSPGSVDWRRDVDNGGSRSSLSAHLPFIRRKLRAYLMPEKSARHNQENNHQQASRNKQESMASNHDGHQVMNGNHITSNKQSASIKMALHYDHHQVKNSNSVGHKQPQQDGNSEVHTAMVDKMLVAKATTTQERHDRQHRGNGMQSPAHRSNTTRSPTHRSNTMRSPAHRAMPPSPIRMDANKLSSMKETQRRGDWAQQEVDDDIEVAERLLRVVKEHQHAALNSHHTAGSYTNMKGGTNRNGFLEQGNGLGAENGGAIRKSRKSGSMSPFSSPARYNTSSKEEYACPYDSDSSSDLFEIETLQAFSHVAGLYRPRDLPVYNDRSPLHTASVKSPLHSSNK
ncbi:hypothetical protein GOP47_0029565 [Adiantum capillus-veneris]|nr:hypothetical protein GOP47_0029565 [Adiantum capillus-veneris]